MNWDDLRIIAAVRDEGSYAGAGARLRIDETTVGRRLARIQRTLGLRLFEAVDGVRKPTRQCEMVLAHVQAMAGHVAEIDRIGESLPGPVGRLRIASTNTVAEEVLSPRAGAFLMQNPGLTLQFLTSSENVKFSRWEADLAIRLRKPDKGDFAISKLTDIRLYFIEPAAGSDVEPVICGFPDELDQIPEARYLESKGMQSRARCITDNIGVIRTLIQSRLAVGVLPEYGCEALLADRRLRATLLPKRRDVWLLVQNHLKRDPAARVAIDWIRTCFQDMSRG
jgi:DNA-binding transcriptional LysR family regulator